MRRWRGGAVMLGRWRRSPAWRRPPAAERDERPIRSASSSRGFKRRAAGALWRSGGGSDRIGAAADRGDWRLDRRRRDSGEKKHVSRERIRKEEGEKKSRGGWADATDSCLHQYPAAKRIGRIRVRVRRGEARQRNIFTERDNT